MTPDILQKIRKRDRLAKIKNRRQEYQKLRNEIVKECRKAERHFFQRRIAENLNDSKEHWKVLKQIMGNTSKSDYPTSFKNDGDVVTDSFENARLFNEFYTQIGIETNQSVGKSKNPPEYFLAKYRPRQEPSIEDCYFTNDNVIEACKQLNAKKSCDAYGLSQAVVKRDSDIVAPMLAHIANCSLNAGIFPNHLKKARVIPVYKEKGEKSLYTNYRPISLLPAFSKILEKLVYNKIFYFLVRYDILFKSQYGFRKGHNTTHASLDFLKTVEAALCGDEYAVGIFCDLSKAFDTLDHKILLHKLEHYGIRGKWHSWFQSYLSDRKQFVDLNGIMSNERSIQVGVPQGSILGPLLFLLYINDLPASLSKMLAVKFADDTNLVIKGRSLEDLANEINSDLASVSDFFKANKLKLNVEKTKMVCFRKKGKTLNEVPIMLDGAKLSYNNSATFLGITLDCHLNWEQHCTAVANKTARNSGILNRLKNYLPKDSLKILYDSLVSSHFLYGLEVWGACPAKVKKRLMVIQKKCVRIISNANWNSHSEPRMKELKVLKLEDQHLYQCATLVFDMLNKNAPDIYDLQQEQNLNTELTTRSSINKPNNVRLPSYSNSKVKSFSSLAPAFWNTLPESLQRSESRNLFKSSLKRAFLTGYNVKVDCTNPRCSDRRYHKCMHACNDV